MTIDVTNDTADNTADGPIKTVWVDIKVTSRVSIGVDADEIDGLADMTSEQAARAAAELAVQQVPDTCFLDGTEALVDDRATFAVEISRPGRSEIIDFD